MGDGIHNFGDGLAIGELCFGGGMIKSKVKRTSISQKTYLNLCDIEYIISEYI